MSVRDFLNRYKLPQLVRIHEAHLQQLNETRRPSLVRSSATNRVGLLGHSDSGAVGQPSPPVDTRFASKLNIQLNSSGQSSTLESNDSGNASSCSSTQPSANGQTSPNGNGRQWTVNNNGQNSSGQNSLTESTSEDASSDQRQQQQQQQQQRDQQQLLDLDQPFLLYKAYSCRQVIAHTLDVSTATDVNRFHRVGPALLIPESYTGEFNLSTNIFTHVCVRFCDTSGVGIVSKIQ